MQVKAREKEGAVVLDIEGTIDINASTIVEAVGWVLKNKSPKIVFNFAGVDLVDYIGISVIAVAYKNIINHKGKMRICNVPGHLRNLFNVVGLTRVFTFFDSEDDALRDINGEDKISEILKKNLRRRFKRIPYFSTIEYRPCGMAHQPYYHGKIINLSAIGLFIHSKKIFPVDQVLDTRIYLTPEPSILEVTTKVVWLADQQIQPQEYPGMGLEFYNIDPERQEAIVAFVDKNFAGDQA